MNSNDSGQVYAGVSGKKAEALTRHTREAESFKQLNT
jgi:hypothetical protein